MRSPRFAAREAQLRPILSRGTLRAVWEKNVRQAMRRQLIADPIDHLDFHQSLSAQCDRIETAIRSGSYSPSPVRRILVEKSKGLCRQLAIPSVTDALILQCLSTALYSDIRGKEPTKNSFFEPEEHRFSNRGLFGQPEYGSFKAWLNFQKEIFRFTKNRPYMVITDISNYYDTISYSHLRNIISDLDIGVRETVLDMLIYVLSGLLWQPDYMPRVEIGLPQLNLDAPRILAHCFLYELDQFLQESRKGDFARYMDDVDAGADNVADAKNLLKCIDLVLQTRQVRLNSGKTQILTRSESLDHFRIRENVILNRIEERIESKVKSGNSVDRERSSISKAFSFYYRGKDRRFDTGNGEKILKRFLRIGTRTGALLEHVAVLDVLTRRPGSRQAALLYLSQLPLDADRAAVLERFSSSRATVDDASHVWLANALVETAVPTRGRGVGLAVTRVISNLSTTDYFQLYARFWLMSKYSEPADVLDTVIKSRGTWAGDPWLGRLVGGLYPVFLRSQFEPAFRAQISKSGNVEAQNVYYFHDDLRRDVGAFRKSFDFLRAPNPSKGTAIAHSKFLLVLSALANVHAPPGHLSALVSGHSRAWSDVYYRQRAAKIRRAPIAATAVRLTPVP